MNVVIKFRNFKSEMLMSGFGMLANTGRITFSLKIIQLFMSKYGVEFNPFPIHDPNT
jgi:hypothetical protein